MSKPNKAHIIWAFLSIGVGFFSRTPKKDPLLRIQRKKSAIDDFERKKRRVSEKEEEIEECEGAVFIQEIDLHDLWFI